MSIVVKTVDVTATGKVQGVSYRAWTRENAQERGLSGWVRNEADGTVHAKLSGPEEQVNEMLGLMHQGPPTAEVETVEAVDADPPDEIGFGVIC